MMSLIPYIVKWMFVLNLIAIVVGLVLSRLGYVKLAKILSYVSIVGVSLAVLYMIVLFVLFSYPSILTY